MKFNTGSFVLFMVLTGILCSSIISFLTLPVIWERFNLSTQATSNIGSTIGGITSPVIGAITSYLLIITLQQQSKANYKQDHKNEIDIVLSLFASLEKDIDSFTTKFSRGTIAMLRDPDAPTEFKYTGIEGLQNFAERLYSGEHKLKTKEYTFQWLPESGQLIYILMSYNLVRIRIEEIDKKAKISTLLMSKLDGLFEAKLHKPFGTIDVYLRKNPEFRDALANELMATYAELWDRVCVRNELKFYMYNYGEVW